VGPPKLLKLCNRKGLFKGRVFEVIPEIALREKDAKTELVPSNRNFTDLR